MKKDECGRADGGVHVKTDNRTTGGKFEQELSGILSDHGFWAHVMQQNKAGQPADIIAIKEKYHTLIDCKVVSDGKGFDFARVEENQKLAMRMFQRRCGELCFFAIRLPDGTMWMVSMERISILQSRGKRRLKDEEIRTQTCPLEKWLADADTWSEET